MRTAFVLIIAGLLSACFDPRISSGLSCGADSACPPSLRCEPVGDVCVDPNLPPVASLRFVGQPPAEIEAEVVAPTLDVELLDANGGVVPITGGSYELSVESSRPVSVVSPTTATADRGVVHIANLLVDRPATSARLRARGGSLSAETRPFDILPTTPEVSWPQLAGEFSSCAAVPYVVKQAQGLPVDVLVEVDPDGDGPLPFRRATQGASAPGSAGVQQVRATSSGLAHLFTWNTSADAPRVDGPARLRLTPSLRGKAGRSLTQDLTVANGLRFDVSETRDVNAQLETVVGDLDGDGWSDLTTAGDGTVDVRLGNSAGQSHLVFDPLNGLPGAVAVGDFDGDGRRDLLISARGIDVAWQSARRMFAQPAYQSSDYDTGLGSPIAADVDGDRRDELIGVTLHGIEVLKYRPGTGRFDTVLHLSDQTNGRISSADLDRDGKVDLIVTSGALNPINIIRQTRDGFAQPEAIPGLHGERVAVADLDGDGRDDVATLDSSGLHVLASQGVIDLPSIEGQALGLADLDRDGRTDVLAARAGKVLAYRHVDDRRVIEFGTAETIGWIDAVDDLDVADVDRDGRPDVIVTSNGGGTLTILRGTTARRCGARPGGPIANARAAPGLGAQVIDENADGKADLVARTAKGIIAKYGLGDGQFDSATQVILEYPSDLQSEPYDLDALDVDGDGLDDIAYLTSVRKAVTLLFNKADTPGTFEDVQLPTSVYPVQMAIGDVDSDGAKDIVLMGTDEIQILRGSPASPRTFAAAEKLATVEVSAERNECTVPGRCDLRLVDLDGDGRLDIFVKTDDRLHVLHAEPSAKHGFGPRLDVVLDYQDELVTVGDVLSDGRVEAVVQTGNASWDPTHHHLIAYTLSAEGTIIEPAWDRALGETAQVTSAAVHDLDHDGKTELLLDCLDGLRILTQDEVHASDSVPRGAPFVEGTLEFADVDGDGREEFLVTGASGGTFVVKIGTDGSLDLGESSGLPAPGVADYGRGESLSLGDFDGDGLLDAAVRALDGSHLRLARQDSAQPGRLMSVEQNVPAVELLGLADLDGDRRADVIAGGTEGGLLYVDIERSGGESRCSGRDDLWPAIAADLDGDGSNDLVGADPQLLSWYEAPATSCVAPRPILSIVRPGIQPVPAVGVFAADMNADGRMDVVTISDATRVALQGADPASFSVTDYDETHIHMAPYASGAVGDLDRDGLPDVVVSGTRGETSLYLSNPSIPGTFLPTQYLDPAQLVGGVAVELGDIDSDGRVDIVLGRDVYLQTETPGRFAYAYSLLVSTVGMAVVDFDGDGKTDLVGLDAVRGVVVLRGR